MSGRSPSGATAPAARGEPSDRPAKPFAPFRCPLPNQSRLAPTYSDADLADAFAAPLPPGATTDPERLARFILARPPLWFRLLLKLRDRIVALAGIRSSTSFAHDHQTAAAASIDFFKLYAVHPDEVIFGEDDRHLDFRTSVLVRARAADPGASEVVSTTVVHCHNRVGRIYLAVIAPIHRLIVGRALLRAARRGWPTSAMCAGKSADNRIVEVRT